MVELVLTVMMSAFSLAQPGHAAITTNELTAPPGMSGAVAKTTSQKQGVQTGNAVTTVPAKDVSDGPTAAPGKRAQASKESPDGVVVDNAKPVWVKATPVAAPAESEAAQPTTEEKQAPTPKQASGSASPGRVAAFWFILPNRPSGNK